MKPLLILASSSRYRRELLDRLCLPYESISPDVDESAQPGETPRETALRLAELKARAGTSIRDPFSSAPIKLPTCTACGLANPIPVKMR